MSDESASSGEGEAVSVLTVDAGTPAELTMNGAAKALADMRFKRNQESSAESAEPATAEPELSDEDNAAPEKVVGEEPQGETQEAEKLPPVERPRSWSKDDDDDWNALPRERQEKIAANERARESDHSRRINEATDKLKGLSAKEQEVEKVKQQFEAGIKAAQDVLEREQRQKFPDIKSWDDYERLSAEASRLSEVDPFTSLRIANYLKDFDTHQKSMQFNAQQLKEIEDQKTRDRQSKRSAYETAQNSRLIELVPDMADPKKAAAKRDSAVAMLTDDLGLKMEDLQRWMADDIGHEILSNAGIQKLMDNGLALKAIQTAKTAVAAKPLPPVQKPGTSKPSGGVSERVQALDSKFNNSGKVNDAVALLVARRNASRRAS